MQERPKYMRHETPLKIVIITELGKTMSQREIAGILGCHHAGVSAIIIRYNLPYQQKKRGYKRGSREPEYGSTAQKLLGMIGPERLIQSEVARELGVSRQRIEQLRDSLGLCQFLTKRGQDKIDARA